MLMLKLILNFSFHGHTCLNSNRDVKQHHGRTLNEKLNDTQKMTSNIMECGYKVIELWECEWDRYCMSHHIKNKYSYPTEHVYRMTEMDILNFVKKEKIFGAIECYIYVPDNLKDYFSEMPPIFINTTVTYDDIGDYMKAYLTETGQVFKERKYLIGSMYVEKILLITPLIKWYLEKGLMISKIHQLIEFRGSKCFKDFVNSVTSDRRRGDADCSLKAPADTSKLVGN